MILHLTKKIHFKRKAMKKMLSAALVVSMMAAACTKENPVQDGSNLQVLPNGDEKCFVADFNDETPVKTVLVPQEKTASVEWLAGDKVSIFAGEGNYLYKAASAGQSTTLVPEGQSAGTAEVYYAVYPYNEAATVSGAVVSTELPVNQTGVKGSFTTHLAVSSSTGTNMTFKNVCGLVKVNIASDNVTSIEFKGNSGEIVAGPVNITVSEGEPTYAPAEGSTATAVVMTPASGSVFEPGDYYFAVLPQSFTAGFTVTSYKNDGRKVVRVANPKDESGIAVGRAKIVTGKSFGISGLGTEASPYVIMTAQDMVDMKDLTDLTAPTYFKIGDNIDMAGVTAWEAVNSVAAADQIAEIHIDGNNKTISNFAPTTVTGLPSLFGVIVGSCKDLTVTDAVINFEEVSHTAILASYIGYYDGTARLSATVDNVHVAGTVIGEKVVGGLAGAIVSSTITNSTAAADATIPNEGTYYYVGGFAAQANGAVTFRNCGATGNVSTTYRKAGGFCAGASTGDAIVGEEGKLVFENCYADVDIKSTSYAAGAFYGHVEKTVDVLVFKNCYATGSIVAQRQLGGIIGVVNIATADITIDSCYYEGSEITGSLSGKNPTNTGGIFGYLAAGSAVVKNSFAKTSLAGKTSAGYVGGIVGYSQGTALSVENCYAECSLDATFPGGIIGYATNTTTLKNCWFAGSGATKICYEGSPVEEGTNSIVEEDLTATQIAVKLGWGSNDAWDLTGDSPKLK